LSVEGWPLDCANDMVGTIAIPATGPTISSDMRTVGIHNMA
jgi:hypothetical protein